MSRIPAPKTTHSRAHSDRECSGFVNLSTEDVQRVVKIASKYHLPVTPFAAGTSLEGHFSSVSELGSGPISLRPVTDRV
jgi:FAD/FMN-containing dehydrogenase